MDDIQAETHEIRAAIPRRDTPVLYDWLVDALSYQGISDWTAQQYIGRHGQATWSRIEAGLARSAACAKLLTYWHYYGCRFDKSSRTCAEPEVIARCPLPRHDLRNGRLNQMAYSLYLFVRDVADGDLVGWIDGQLKAADHRLGADQLAGMRAALIEPLRNVYGVSDKVLTMALSMLMLGAPEPQWVEVGGSMIVIDRLVHNFLHRSGILRRCGTAHAYGTACYRPTGCADVIRKAASLIDARAFNPNFPANFPRFVQHAIWRYCAQQGLNVCNGNRIDDRNACDNVYCAIRGICERITLRKRL